MTDWKNQEVPKDYDPPNVLTSGTSHIFCTSCSGSRVLFAISFESLKGDVINY